MEMVEIFLFMFLMIFLMFAFIILIMCAFMKGYRNRNPTFDLYRENNVCKITGQKCLSMSLWYSNCHNDCRKCMVPINYEKEKKIEK